MGDLGLINALPPSFALALTLLTVGFIVEVSSSEPRKRVLCVYIVALLCVLYATDPALFEVPRYAWTYKHIGITRVINARGGVTRSSELYDNWSGFFGVAALGSRLAGLDAVRFAAWLEFAFGGLEALAVGYLVSGLTNRRSVVFVSVWLFLITNWVGQNYYAPQPLAFTFAVLMYGLAVRHLCTGRPLIGRRIPLVPVVKRSTYRDLLSGPDTFRVWISDNWPTLAFILLFVGAVTTHPLTPFMILLAVIALVALAGLRPLWLLPLLFAITGGWFYLARPFLVYHPELYNFGTDAAANASRTVLPTQSAGSLLVVHTSTVLSLAIWMLGAIGGLIGLRLKLIDRRLIALAVSPFAVLGGLSYGGEAIFRVYLFSLPAIAFAAAVVLSPRPGRTLHAIVSGWILLGLTGAFVVSYFGKDEINRIQPGELELGDWVAANVPPGGSIAQVFGNFLTGATTRIAEHFPVIPGLTIDDLPASGDAKRSVSDTCGIAERWRNSYGSPLFIIASLSQERYARTYGILPRGAIDNLNAFFASCGEFVPVFHNSVGTIFRIGP